MQKRFCEEDTQSIHADVRPGIHQQRNGFSTTSNYLPPVTTQIFRRSNYKMVHHPSTSRSARPWVLRFPWSAVTLEETHRGTPYVQQWNFGLQRELPGGWMVEGVYAGNRGIHLYSSNYQFNDLDPKYLSLGLSLQDQVPNPLAGQIPGALGAATVARRQTLLPYPQYSGVTVFNPLGGASTYHSFQARALHRFERGLTAACQLYGRQADCRQRRLAAGVRRFPQQQSWYQAGKFNRRVERSVDPPTLRKLWWFRLLMSFRSTRKQVRLTTGFLNAALGNWSLSGILTVQGGLPLVIRGASKFSGRPAEQHGCQR